MKTIYCALILIAFLDLKRVFIVNRFHFDMENNKIQTPTNVIIVAFTLRWGCQPGLSFRQPLTHFIRMFRISAGHSFSNGLLIVFHIHLKKYSSSKKNELYHLSCNGVGFGAYSKDFWGACRAQDYHIVYTSHQLKTKSLNITTM